MLALAVWEKVERRHFRFTHAADERGVRSHHVMSALTVVSTAPAAPLGVPDLAPEIDQAVRAAQDEALTLQREMAERAIRPHGGSVPRLLCWAHSTGWRWMPP